MIRSVEMAKQAREYGERGVAAGAWIKIGRSHYRHHTGVEILKGDRGWEAGGYVWPSRFAAMSHVSYSQRSKSN